MDWQEEYRSKLVTAEEAVSIIESGDLVAFPLDNCGGPVVISEALVARLGELKNVEINMCTPTIDFGWFQPGWEESFRITVEGYGSPVVRPLMDSKAADYSPRLYSLWGKAQEERRPGIRETDVVMTVVSPPDEHGYCSFGGDIWSKKWYIKNSKKVIVEVDENHIRTYGDNRVHVSEIDYFVKYTREPREFVPPNPEEYMKAIGHYVGTLVNDGDTFGIGAGRIGRTLCGMGIFDNRHDLGYYAENIVQGVVELVRKGVVTGKRKTFHPGKVVCNNFYTGDPDELAFINNNPMFELYPQDYVVNIRNVAANDNMVAINSALSVDLTGQIASESIGPRMYTGSGGQPSMAIGAMLSKGGRAITMLRSTTTDGKISRIMPFLEPGTIVTVPRNFADYIVTEYGIASLLGKTQRERAQELIAIAHPDFRAELRKQAQKLFWP